MSSDELAGVVTLLCRACHNHLPAASNDIAFRCPRCGRAWEVEGRGLVPLTSRYVVPPAQAERPTIYLPYWSFDARIDLTAVEPAPETVRARERAMALTRAWVAACAIHRPSYVGDWALVYTRVRPVWEEREGGGPAAPGASIASEDARTLARHYLLAEIDRACDLSNLEIEIELATAELHAIPCYDLGDRLRCPWMRGEVPAAALNDLSEIRKAADRPGA